jgi:DNA-binding response OmpR family regulator
MDKLRLMVTDDFPSVRASLRVMLEDRYEVREAADGEEAVRAAERGEVALVLMDVMMPGMDGLEALRLIKASNATIEVCMVTALPDAALKSQAAELGAFDYIVKPFDVEQVRQTVAKMESVVRRKLRLNSPELN